MARAPAGLPAGTRLSDHISLGVLAKTFPLDGVQRVLADTGKQSERERDLPAHVVAYYIIALALHMTASMREVLRAACWKACAGSGAPRRSGSRARAASRRCCARSATAAPKSRTDTRASWSRRQR